MKKLKLGAHLALASAAAVALAVLAPAAHAARGVPTPPPVVLKKPAQPLPPKAGNGNGCNQYVAGGVSNC